MNNWKLINANEARSILPYRTEKALRLAAQNGLIPCVKIGKRVLFDPDQLKEWAAKGGTPLPDAENNTAQDQTQSLATAA